MPNPFKLPSDLTDPEKDLIAKAKAGQLCSLGSKRPGENDDDTTRNVIRAEVVMHLALGGDPEDPVHPKGIQLQGGWIVGQLRLQHAALIRPVGLYECYIESEPILQHARAGLINLKGSWVPGLDADSLVTEGPLFLRDGFEAAGMVNLASAKIGGHLDCSGSKFLGADIALQANGLVTKGPVFLRHGFEAMGEVNLVGADIGSDLDCKGGAFLAPGFALAGDRSRIGGNLFLSSEADSKGEPMSGDALRGFIAHGLVRFPAATVDGALFCDGGRFQGAGGEALRLDGITVKGRVLMCAAFNQDATLADGAPVFEASGAVRLNGATIGGDLQLSGGKIAAVETAKGDPPWFRLYGARIEGTLHFGTGIKDSPPARLDTPVDLRATSVGTLLDCPQVYAGLDKLEMRLDGFIYRRIDGPTNAEDRIKWLDRQPPEDKGAGFKPQPYEQLAKVLREMGHTEDAKRIAILKQRKQRWANLIRSPANPVQWFWFTMSLIFEAVVGFGYRPFRALLFALGFIVIGYFVFDAAYEVRAMVPNNPSLLKSEWKTALLTANPYDSFLSSVPDFQPFSPLVYSIDTFVPLVTLHQEKHWIPQPEGNDSAWSLVRLYLWIHIAIGWIITALAAASLTGVVKKDV